jgi:hypothetical protein
MNQVYSGVLRVPFFGATTKTGLMARVGTADTTAKMLPMFRRHREARKALKLARLLAALDSAAGETRRASRRAGRLSFGRA